MYKHKIGIFLYCTNSKQMQYTVHQQGRDTEIQYIGNYMRAHALWFAFSRKFVIIDAWCVINNLSVPAFTSQIAALL